MNAALQNSLLGSLVADAVAMPVHWYYDTAALDREYGEITSYLAPRNPHPGSILWRSSYTPRNEKADILHEQARYWGQRGIHYHQFLPAGDNTLNYLLAIQLYRSTVRRGKYDPDAWLETYIKLMQTPGWHEDTYMEEYHRAFFDRYAQGNKPRNCGIEDIHIGALASVPSLVAALDALNEDFSAIDPETVRSHVKLTHRSQPVDEATLALTRMLLAIAEGSSLCDAIEHCASGWIGPRKLEKLARLEDREIVGKRFSSACYLPDSFTASLALAWKYADDFTGGVLANAHCGGDNCHRGAVVGSLLAAANEIPEQWLAGLRSMERLRCDTLDPVFTSV